MVSGIEASDRGAPQSGRRSTNNWASLGQKEPASGLAAPRGADYQPKSSGPRETALAAHGAGREPFPLDEQLKEF